MTFPISSRSCADANDVPKRSKDSDPSSLQHDTLIKIRKPYTISKQREKWTDDEHQKFLEALKLYGRAWQSIKEHIGTKTTIQIRSHAQKFFSKLERNGSSMNEKSGEIEIPPPRPKKRPNHPYPRKAGSSVSTCTLVVDDAESPRTVCSAFVPFGSPPAGDTWPAPTEVVEEVTATKLRLFGTSFLVPEKDDLGVEREPSPKSEVSEEMREITGSVFHSSDTQAGMSDGMEPISEPISCDAEPDANGQPSMQNRPMNNVLKSNIFDPQILQQMPFPLNMSYLTAFPPPIPVCWQNPVPPYTFAHMKNDDLNSAAAFAAATATFAVASAWQAMHMPLPVSNNVSVLYSPIAILKKPETQVYERDSPATPHVNTSETEIMETSNAHQKNLSQGDSGENPTTRYFDMKYLREQEERLKSIGTSNVSTELPLKSLEETVQSRYQNERMKRCDTSTEDARDTFLHQRIHQSQVPARNLEFGSITDTNHGVQHRETVKFEECRKTTSLSSAMFRNREGSAFTARAGAKEGVDQTCRKSNERLAGGRNPGQILSSRYRGNTGFVPYQSSLRMGRSSK